MNDQTAKKDDGKLQISLVPTQLIRDVAEVRMYGNQKYGDPDNWKSVEKKRYIDALLRHLLAYLDDPEGVDEESGIPHYKHAACNIAFICSMEAWEREVTKPNPVEMVLSEPKMEVVAVVGTIDDSAEETEKSQDPPEPIPEAMFPIPPKPKGSRSNSVDWKKAQALRDAGWKLKQIAEELYTNESSVSKMTKPAKAKQSKPLEFT